MPVKRRIQKSRDRTLGLMERWSLELGDDERRPAFASDAERRATWEYHREAMLADERPRRRPRAWWEYDAPIPWPGYDDETVALYKAGLLRRGACRADALVARAIRAIVCARVLPLSRPRPNP